MTYSKRPRVGRVYAPQGHETRPAEQGLGFNSLRRIAVCLDIQTGAVIARQRGTYPVKEFARFLLLVERRAPDARLIYIALDTWPVHFHPFVRDELLAHHSRIRWLSLPTSAPWPNPVEKVWLQLDQDILDQHELAHDWETLKQKVVDWFVPLEHGSVQMLRTVGLCPD